MPPRPRFGYSDAKRDDPDMERILRCLHNFTIDTPTTPQPQAGPSGTITYPNATSPISERSSDSEGEDPYLSALDHSSASHDIPTNDPDRNARRPPRSDSGSDSEGSDVYWADDDDRDAAWWEEAYALADEGDDERVYSVTVGRETGTITRWARAGSASQGYPGGTVRRLVTITPPTTTGPNASPNVAWVVYEGLRPGVYSSWDLAKAQTNRVSGNVHQGFTTRTAADDAYRLAYALNCVRSIRDRNSTAPPPAPFEPLPARVYETLTQASDHFQGAEWHVVFRGRRPGVYPAWNFVANETKGVSCAIYQKFRTKALAERAFNRAYRHGEVHVLT